METYIEQPQIDARLIADLEQIDTALEVGLIGDVMSPPVIDLLRVDIATLQAGVRRGDAEAEERARDLVAWVRETVISASTYRQYKRTA
jgi:hypothetical protein